MLSFRNEWEFSTRRQGATISSRFLPMHVPRTPVQHKTLLQPPLAPLNLCCHKAAAGAKWLSAPVALSWATLIFLSLATEDAGCDFSQLILMGIASAGTGRNWMNYCTNCKDAKGTHPSSNSPSPAGNDCVTVNPSIPWSETILLPTSPKEKKWLISSWNSAGFYFPMGCTVALEVPDQNERMLPWQSKCF